MSGDNVEAVRRGFQAFERRDRDAATTLLDPEVAWYPALGALLGQSSYHGPEAVAGLVLDEIPSVIEGFTSEVQELRDVGDDTVLVIVRFRGRVPSAQMEIEQVFGQVYRLRDGKVVEMRSYSSREQALAALGLDG